MNDEQPTQPLTDAELSALRDYIERTNHVDNLRGDARRLLAEVDRLRAEATGTALGHLAKIERLQSQRDALVRKLGLDWGPDEFGDLDTAPDRAEQISAVMSLHQPTAMNSWGHRTCTECDTPGYYQEWPCPTLVALGFEER